MKSVRLAARPLCVLVVFIFSRVVPQLRVEAHTPCPPSERNPASYRDQKAQNSMTMGYGALDTVFKLGRMRSAAFFSRLRDGWTARSSNTPNDVDNMQDFAARNGNSIATPLSLEHSSASPLQSLIALFKRGVVLGGARLRRGSIALLTILIAAACVFSVAANNIAARPVRMDQKHGDNDMCVSDFSRIEEASHDTGGSIDALEAHDKTPQIPRQLWWRKRRFWRLPKGPTLPLAYGSWLEVFHNQRKRMRRRTLSALVEGLEAENHEVTKRAEGAQIFRAAQFWSRSATIYFSYKKMQARCALELPLIADEAERELKRRDWWDRIHELNSDRMLKLCLDLRGFYLKSGQFLGTRHDFMPKIFLKKLGKLHDDVPPMPAKRVFQVVSRELELPPEEVFSSLNLTHPVGSASISQVHRGILKSTGEKVAVKVQYPGAERVMMSDLRNLKTLAWFLQKFELNFDILSSLRELSRQIKNEFDFRAEAGTMDRMHDSLRPYFSRVDLPQSRLSTKRLLVMSFLEGESLAQLKRGKAERFVAARKRIGKRMLLQLADAWGYMIFSEGLFNADPHPGNILIIPEERVGPIKRALSLLGLRTPKLRIGLLDWGQTKELGEEDRQRVANLILAVRSGRSTEIVRHFNSLGVKLSKPEDDESIEKLALVMFDTRTMKGSDMNPFSSSNVLKLNAVQEYPQDLYFILRTVLMFRGMAKSLGVEFSIADTWAPHASRLLLALEPGK